MKNLHFLEIKSNHLVISKSQKLKIFPLASKQLKRPAVTIQIGRTGHRIWFDRLFEVAYPQKRGHFSTRGRIWNHGKCSQTCGWGHRERARVNLGSERYNDVINAMFKCNLSCNDVQENEICLNDSCKSHDGDENECKYSLWSPWSICNCKTQEMFSVRMLESGNNDFCQREERVTKYCDSNCNQALVSSTTPYTTPIGDQFI